MGALDGLDLAGRAELLGLTARAYVAFMQGNQGVFAPPSLETVGSVFRARRWFDAGRPDAAPERLTFSGSDDVRELVVEVLRSLPAPVRHYAVEAVTWIEVGRGTVAWIGRAPTLRALPGDLCHVVVINGRASNEDLHSVIAHELGHGWHRPVIETEPTFSTLSEREAIAARHLFAKYTGGAKREAADREQWIRACVANEALADAQAAAWGTPPRGHDLPYLRRHFEAQYEAAAAFADECDRRESAGAGAGADYAADGARAAAIEGAP